MPRSSVATTRELKDSNLPGGGPHSIGPSRLFASSCRAAGWFNRLSRSLRHVPSGRGTAAGLFRRPGWNLSRMVFGISVLLWALALPCWSFSWSQSQAGKPATRDTTDLKIQVRGGETGVPVKNASVYVEYRQGRFLAGKKKYKYGVKTNSEGVAAVRDAPKGKILIQVVAEGWKTFGKVYEIENDEATVEILLQRPKKWY